MVKAWKFGEPAYAVEVDDEGCPFCVAASLSSPGIIFIEVEGRGIRRCEVFAHLLLKGIKGVWCEETTPEAALKEIKDAP